LSEGFGIESSLHKDKRIEERQINPVYKDPKSKNQRRKVNESQLLKEKAEKVV
jgi:hypothetical protein